MRRTLLVAGAAALALLVAGAIARAGSLGGPFSDVYGSPEETGSASGDLAGTYPGPTVVSSHLASPLPYAQGGTGASSLTQHGAVVAGASALSVVAPGAAGHLYRSNGTDWASAAGPSESTEITGTGSAQNFAHGLAVTPSIVLVVPTNTTDVGIVAAGFATSYTADGTNVAVTATSGLKYRVLAMP